MATTLLSELLVLFPCGVTVVTTRDPAAGDHGMTVGAFVPVSLAPPLVLVCIDCRARMHDVMCGATHFAINVLDADAVATARRFASSIPDRFAGVEFDRGIVGVPLLRDVVAHLQCRVERRYWGGDHSIFVGEVLNGDASEGEPLLYRAHSFGRLEVREPARRAAPLKMAADG
jgi:flavin reductase (DIM6/NTAB) family NADH-FMN oxidoreductase RutF